MLVHKGSSRRADTELPPCRRDTGEFEGDQDEGRCVCSFASLVFRELTFADLGGKSPVLQRGEDTVLAYQLSNKMKNKVVWVNTDLVGLGLHLFCSLLMPQQDS